MSASPVLTGLDPVYAAWLASGSPQEHAGSRVGSCARCLRHGTNHAPVTAIAGENFTGFTGWLGSPAGGICPACAWAYRNSSLRNAAHLITTQPAGLWLLPVPGLYARLLGGPIAPYEALTVPLRPGRKHVLPEAQWGMVLVDDTAIQWTPVDTHRLQLISNLRDSGATPTQLRAPTPPWTLVKNASPATRSRLMAQWQAIDPWSTRRPWMDVALLATNKHARRSAR